MIKLTEGGKLSLSGAIVRLGQGGAIKSGDESIYFIEDDDLKVFVRNKWKKIPNDTSSIAGPFREITVTEVTPCEYENCKEMAIWVLEGKKRSKLTCDYHIALTAANLGGGTLTALPE